MIRFFFILLALIFGAMLFQLFLPPILLLGGSAVLFVPILYFYGCLSLPFPLTLALTFFTGLLQDLLHVPQTKGHIDFPLGTSIVIYLVPGLVMHGLKPLFEKHFLGTHYLLAELSALLTPFILLAQYGILSLERGGFYFKDVIAWRIIGPGIISLFIAPCVFFILTPLSHTLGYKPGFFET